MTVEKIIERLSYNEIIRLHNNWCKDNLKKLFFTRELPQGIFPKDCRVIVDDRYIGTIIRCSWRRTYDIKLNNGDIMYMIRSTRIKLPSQIKFDNICSYIFNNEYRAASPQYVVDRFVDFDRLITYVKARPKKKKELYENIILKGGY